MQFKYSVNGLDLTDTVGLADYAPKYFLDVGTTRPSARRHKHATVESQKNGSVFVADPRSTSSLVSLNIAVTSFGPEDSPEKNFAVNAALIEGIFLEDQGFPVLRYFPEKDMEELITTADKYYGNRTIVKSATWSATSNESDWQYYKVILEVPDGYLYGEWKEHLLYSWVQTGEPPVLTHNFSTPYNTLLRDTDWLITMKDFGAMVHTASGSTIEVFPTDKPTEGIVINVPEVHLATGLRLIFFSDLEFGLIGTSTEIPEPDHLVNSTSEVTEDDYQNLVNATAVLTGEELSSEGRFTPNSVTGSITVRMTGLNASTVGMLYYRERL